MVAQRRKAEDEDDLAKFFGTPPSLYAAEDAVDELGRAIPSAASPAARQARLAARQTRRALRKQAQAQKHAAADDEEGFSTDATLAPADEEDYRTAMGRLLADGKALMDDVRAEEFRDPAAGLARWFGEWRAKFADVYTGAWGGLGMVSAWEFWVRLEMLGWNPLEVRRLRPVLFVSRCSALTEGGAAASTESRLVPLVHRALQVLPSSTHS